MMLNDGICKKSDRAVLILSPRLQLHTLSRIHTTVACQWRAPMSERVKTVDDCTRILAATCVCGQQRCRRLVISFPIVPLGHSAVACLRATFRRRRSERVSEGVASVSESPTLCLWFFMRSFAKLLKRAECLRIWQAFCTSTSMISKPLHQAVAWVPCI